MAAEAKIVAAVSPPHTHTHTQPHQNSVAGWWFTGCAPQVAEMAKSAEMARAKFQDELRQEATRAMAAAQMAAEAAQERLGSELVPRHGRSACARPVCLCRITT